MKSTITVFLLAITISSYAQDKKQKHNFTSLMTKSIGVSFQEFSGLNSRVAVFPQYEQLKNNLWTLSLGSMHVKNNFISQFTVTGGSSLSGDRDRKSSALRILGAGLDFGYDVIPADRIMLYPLVGVGAETYHAIFYKDNAAVDFNTVLQSPIVQNEIRSVKFTNSFFTYRAGLGFALKSSGNMGKEKSKGTGTIGIQLGYVGGFDNKRWKSSENQTLNNAPLDDQGRFYVSLVFGGGGRMKR